MPEVIEVRRLTDGHSGSCSSANTGRVSLDRAEFELPEMKLRQDCFASRQNSVTLSLRSAGSLWTCLVSVGLACFIGVPLVASSVGVPEQAMLMKAYARDHVWSLSGGQTSP